MARLTILLISITYMGLFTAPNVSAQTSDRAQRVDRLDRIRDRAITRERMIERTIRDRRLEERIIDEDPVEVFEDRTETDASIDAEPNPRTLILNDRRERIRRGEVLALNPSTRAINTLTELGLREVRQSELGSKDTLYLFRGDGFGNISDIIGQLRTLDPAGLYTPNHIFSPNQAGLSETVEAKPLTSTSLTSKQACNVGVIDGPIDESWPIFSGLLAKSESFDGNAAATDHGTSVVARLILTAREFSKQAKLSICAANVFSDDTPGAVSADALAAAIAWQDIQDVPIVNVSLAGPDNKIVAYMVARFLRNDRVMVAAVGNGGPLSHEIYPAAYEGVIGVTAIDVSGEAYPLATRGAHVDIAAIGMDLDFSMIGIDELSSGTSFAAPVITAWLIFDTQSHVSQSPTLVDLGIPGLDEMYGAGALYTPPNAEVLLAASNPDSH